MTTGRGAGTVRSPAGDFAYVACSGDREVWVLRLEDADTAPHIVQKAEMPAPAGTDGGIGTPMAFSPDGLFAYLALRVPPFRLLCYRRDPMTGRLDFLDESRLPGSTPFLAVDGRRTLLFSASNPGAIVAANRIDATGRVQWPAVQVVHTGHKSHCVAVSPDDRHVYATATDDGLIHQWRLAGGDFPLQPLDPATWVARPFADVRHMVLSADGRSLYLSTEDHGTTIVMSVDRESGTLSEIQRISLFEEADGGHAHAADIQRSPDGRHLYVSERVSNCIVVFAIQSDGRLTRAGAYPTEVRPRSFAINRQGSLMLVAGQNSHAVRCHAVESATGRLREGFRLAVGRTPTWVSLFAATGLGEAAP